MTNTYWNGCGKHQGLRRLLLQMIPPEGAVGAVGVELEKFRVASNCYYDLFNNGLCNKYADFKKIFRAIFVTQNDVGYYRLIHGEEKYLEREMDKIILRAANEQGLLDPAYKPHYLLTDEERRTRAERAELECAEQRRIKNARIAGKLLYYWRLLGEHNGNMSAAARTAGVSRATVERYCDPASVNRKAWRMAKKMADSAHRSTHDVYENFVKHYEEAMK